MTARQYIIDPTEERGATLGLLPGINYFKTQLTKGGPWIGVKTVVHEPRDAAGDLCGDCAYCVWIGENEIPWDRWGNGRMTLIGEQITEPEYNYLLKALDWDKANLGLDERKAVDLMALPPVAPPTRSPLPCDIMVVEYIGLDTPAASALADAILPPLDVECEE